MSIIINFTSKFPRPIKNHLVIYATPSDGREFKEFALAEGLTIRYILVPSSDIKINPIPTSRRQLRSKRILNIN